MKDYNKPEIEIINIADTEIIMTSPDNNEIAEIPVF